VETIDQFAIRVACIEEADACADLWLESRRAAFPAIPLPIHDGASIHGWLRSKIAVRDQVWVVESGEQLLAIMVLCSDGEVDQLYVRPEWTCQGIGTRMLEFAKKRNPAGLHLWVFQTNTDARRFYERHGFVAFEMTGGNNEEGAPDVRYRWPET
jgi:GNAT superfamily N-acetyltransferase